MYPLLDTINSPSQLRELDQKKLPQFAKELRSFLIESVAKTQKQASVNYRPSTKQSPHQILYGK